MRRALLLLLALGLLASGVAAEELDYLDKLPPLIDREVFFGDPEITRGQISPDGKYISFLKFRLSMVKSWLPLLIKKA